MPSLLAAVAGTLALLTAAPDSVRITAASNVRLRAAPSEIADIVTTVPIGTSMSELETGGRDGDWVRLRAEDGRDGWVPIALTRRVDAATRLAAIDRLVGERLARRGDAFAARAEVVDLVERTRAEVTGDPERAARFSLYWLRGVASTLETIPPSQAKRDPYVAWIDARKDALVFDRSTGRWFVRRDAVLDRQTAFRATAAADDLAWLAAMNGLPGACENFLPCAMRRRNDLEGEYLRRMPNGTHAEEAVARITGAAVHWMSNESTTGGSIIFTPAKDCGELIAAIDPLRAAVATSGAPSRTNLVQTLDRVRSRCGR